MNFSYNSGVYHLRCEQELELSLDSAWAFFSSTKNLEMITPSELRFNINSLDTEQAYEGQIITYMIRLNKIFKMNWVTEITSIEEPIRFVDEQRFGPYKMWHHIHTFEASDNGVLMKNNVYFKLPSIPFSKIFFKFYIKPNLENIFGYRREKLSELIQSKKLK